MPREVPTPSEHTGKEIGIMGPGPAGIVGKKDFKSEDSIVRRSPGLFPAMGQPR